MISTTVEEAGPCRRKMTLEISAEHVAKTHEELLAQYSRSVRIPGFRPGRAPAPMVAKRFARQLREDLRDRLVPEAYHTAIDQEKLSPVAILELNPGKPDPDQAFSFDVTVDVAPDFETPIYKGIAVKAEPVAPVEDTEVEDILERIRASRARYDEVEEQRPLAEHDLARIDFTATLDDKPLSESVPSATALDKGNGFQISLDENAFLPDLAKGLEGATVGEQRDIDVTFPEGFTLSDLAGKTARFHVTVTGLRERVLPEADDEFAKQMDVDGIEDLRRRIREDVETRRRDAEEGRIRNEIARHLIDSVTMDLPQSVVDRSTQNLIYERVQENARRGVPEKELVEHKAEIFERAQQDARGQLSLTYILHRIADLEKISVSDKDVSAEADRIIAGAGPSAETVRKRFTDTKVREDLRERMLSGRVMEFLRNEAQVTPAEG